MVSDDGSIQTETAMKDSSFMTLDMEVEPIHGRTEIYTRETFLKISVKARYVIT